MTEQELFDWLRANLQLETSADIAAGFAVINVTLWARHPGSDEKADWAVVTEDEVMIPVRREGE